MADTREQFSYSLMKFLAAELGDINNLPLCQSPIEAMMFYALNMAAYFNPNVTTTIYKQEQIGSYRVDFLVVILLQGTENFPPIQESIVVECDGHDYHERTKEQASRDKERDRTLQQMGYKVFRFTGSDIWNDVMPCATQVINSLDEHIQERNMDRLRQLVSKGK